MNNSAYPELIPQKIRSALFQPFPDPTYNSGMAVQTTGATSSVNVKISIEIQADSAAGFDDGLQRTVKENCHALRFKSAEFEE